MSLSEIVELTDSDYEAEEIIWCKTKYPQLSFRRVDDFRISVRFSVCNERFEVDLDIQALASNDKSTIIDSLTGHNNWLSKSLVEISILRSLMLRVNRAMLADLGEVSYFSVDETRRLVTTGTPFREKQDRKYLKPTLLFAVLERCHFSLIVLFTVMKDDGEEKGFMTHLDSMSRGNFRLMSQIRNKVSAKRNSYEVNTNIDLLYTNSSQQEDFSQC